MSGAPHLVGFAEIGTYLREMREARHLPLERPVRDLHLRTSFIQALEEGRLDALPAMAYARGYTKNYAEYLGLDTAMILRAFDEAMHFRDPIHPPGPTRQEARPHRVLLLACALGLLLLMGAWRLFWPSHAPVVEDAAPPAPVAHPLPKISARSCLSHLPVENAGPACYSTPSAETRRPSPAARYGTELQLPTEPHP